MSYIDSINKLQEMSRAYETIYAVNERLLEITSPLQQFAEQIKNITQLPNGLTSAIDAAVLQMNSCVSGLKYSAAETSKLGEALLPLKEMSLYKDNNINNLISGVAPIIENIQTLLPQPQLLADAFNNTHFLEKIDEITAFHSPFDNIINSFAQPDVLERTIWEYEQTAGVESTTSSEEIAEFRDDLQDITVDNRNFQQKIADKINKWKEKNPVICFFIVAIILPLLVSQLSDHISDVKSDISGKIHTPKAVIKEEPNTSGTVIYNITINQEVTIIDDARYYYKVQFYIEGSDEPIIGWVSKRSIEINDDDTSDGQNAIPVILDHEPTEPVDTYINP
ncbi:MAG: SH3 domain-containing protein [Oscillospiraceae bacterium]|nr:SH3 domain-containing protein [Oscillospiraceae bacterium]